MAASVTEEETTHNDNQKQTVKEERESFTCAMRLVNASVLPLALKTVVDLGILDVLSMADPDVGLTAAEIGDTSLLYQLHPCQIPCMASVISAWFRDISELLARKRQVGY